MAGKHVKKRKRQPLLLVLALLLTLSLAAGAVFLVDGMVLPALNDEVTETGGTTAAPDTTNTTAAETTASAVPTAPESEPPAEEEPPEEAPVRNFARPEEMRAAWLVEGVDYRLTENDTDDRMRQQIDAALDTLVSWKWNTVIVPLDGRTVGEAFDPAAYLTQRARERELFVYGVLDLHVGDENGADPMVFAERVALWNDTLRTAKAYDMDGYLLANYSYAYQQAPLLHGYAAGMIDQLLRQAAAFLRAENPDWYIGLLTNAVWAHRSVDEHGSETASVYEEYTDGCADTRTLVLDGAVDFVMVQDFASTSHSGAGFTKVLDWWAALCREAELPLYIAHAADKAEGAERGWSSPDQLARQLLSCQKADGWRGSAFRSFAALKAHEASAGALRQAMDGTLMEEYISRELVVSEPAKASFTTYESALILRGSADPNFPLTLNGQPVELTDHGFFALDMTLKLGENTFTFVHKGKTVTYRVTYRVKVLESVSPAGSVKLDGGTEVILSALAYRGSTVYAMVNGTKVPMAVSASQEEEGTTGGRSDYVRYTGTYTLPAGIIGREQALGAFTVHATYQSQSESATGGSLTVAALPEPPPESGTEERPVTLPDLEPINPDTGGEALATGKILIITADYAETFSGDTTDDYSRPTNAYLPKGTTDVYVRTVYDADSGRSYYLLGCGRRVYCEDAEVYIDSGRLSGSELTVGAATADRRATTLTFSADWRVPYNLQLLPQTYTNPVTQDYSIQQQTTEYIDITFSYVTKTGGAPDVSKSPLFSRAEWRMTAKNMPVLRLYLTKTAQFYGYSVAWDDEGRLTFAFRHPASVADNPADQPLKGFKVVLDPGHGGNSVGTAGGNVAEKTLALRYGQLLCEKLEALGAEVVMTRTGDTSLGLLERTQITRAADADLFISLHMDGFQNTAASGCSVHYFNEYSRAASEMVYNRIQQVYKAAGGTANRGWKWDPFYVTRVHDLPSMLIECGFMTNAGDLERLVSADFQERFTSALADGVVNYAKSLPKL